MGIQIIIIMYVNLFFTIYQGRVRPFIKRSMNRLEYTNESLTSLGFMTYVSFTDFTGPVEQLNMGYVLLSFLFLKVAINLMIVVSILYTKMKLISIKIYNIVDRKLV
jgi:outer membrane protein W